MELLACGPTDEASEYGSEFTPDEEEVLNGLLKVQPVLESTDNPIINPELQRQNAEEDGEGSRGLRLPAESANKRFQVQRHNHNEVSTNGMFCTG